MHIRKYDLTTPFKATFNARCTEDEPDGHSSWTQSVNFIFKNERQFYFFKEDRNMLTCAFESMLCYDDDGNEKKGVQVSCPHLEASGVACDFEGADADVPEYDDDPDSATYKAGSSE